MVIINFLTVQTQWHFNSTIKYFVIITQACTGRQNDVRKTDSYHININIAVASWDISQLGVQLQIQNNDIP